MIDISHLLVSLISSLWWVIFIFVFLGLYAVFKPYLKGRFGELAVATHVRLYLKAHYILLNDCTLPVEASGTTQIDHILLSPYGIFVIETKNYKGWIFGQERQKTWTQKIYKKSYQFQNPLHQNYKHTRVLENILADIVGADVIHSIVVFMPDCTFKTEMPKNVFRGAAWVDYVKQFKDDVISPIELKQIQLRIEKEVLKKSCKTHRKHVQNLKQNQINSSQ